MTDYISRPFDVAIVRRRVSNTMLLSARQRRLVGIVTEQIYEKEKSNQLMISILSHIVEFRNGESGLHVLHINSITGLLLKQLARKTDRYKLSNSEITLISTASALHDIGKISIPGEVLNKPGRLTKEEFEIIKTHSLMGAQMLDNLPEHQRDSRLVRLAYEICRWHHERYDGRGYPDGLKGEEIPISAQVVALADVYDALTSERCYKKAIPHEKAMQMIINGECGIFNPLLLECLTEVGDVLEREVRVNSLNEFGDKEMHSIAEQLHDYELSSTERMLTLLEYERQRVQFLTETADESMFTYTDSPSMLMLNRRAAACFGLEELIVEPMKNPKVREWTEKTKNIVDRKLQDATVDSPCVEMDFELETDGGIRRCHLICRKLWASETDGKCLGIIGKITEND